MTDSSLFENTGDGIIYTGIVPLITVVEPVVSNQHSVLIIPGGGYRRIVYEREGLDVGRWIAGQGYTAFILSYRMPSVNGYYSFADAKNALNFISYWAGMSERTFKSVGCMGFSAGGHLAGYITHLHYEEETSVRPDWMALIYPVISLDRSIAHQGCRKRLLDAGESEYSASLENSVTEYMPPVFIVHATDDKDVPVIHSLRYFNSIRDKGHHAEAHFFDKGGHGFGVSGKNGYPIEKWQSLLLEWLAEHKFH
ncbi:TPA: alpha/beta hydrolase [Escherichia coli]